MSPSDPRTHGSSAERMFYCQWSTDKLRSPQNDSTREKSLELHIQSRVNAELKKLHEQAQKDFETLSSKISEKTASEKSSSEKDANKSAGDHLRDLGRESVQNEVAELKKKLEQRKRVRDVDESVEKAKSDVVRCLRENDRRPLDCWREVEAFKREVSRLEGSWVEKVVQ